MADPLRSIFNIPGVSRALAFFRGPMVMWGDDDPEGVVKAPTGTLYLRRAAPWLLSKTTNASRGDGWRQPWLATLFTVPNVTLPQTSTGQIGEVASGFLFDTQMGDVFVAQPKSVPLPAKTFLQVRVTGNGYAIQFVNLSGSTQGPITLDLNLVQAKGGF